jgi:citrate lyase subunit beta/citryl-CoA lyase
VTPSLPPIRSWLYAPGNNARVLEKVFDVGADAVILDLEDAVPPGEKTRARDLVADTVRGRAGQPRPAVFVRVNHPSSGLVEDEVRAIVGPGLTGVRVPKVEDAATVEQVDAWIATAETAAPLAVGRLALVCNIESARGLANAEAIARARPRVLALAFGGADLARDLSLVPGPDGLETLYARSQLVLASRLAGVRPPVDGVYTHLSDEHGLERGTRQGRALGFFGRSALHPRQVPIINSVYTPSEDEVAWASEVVAAAERAEADGSGALQLPNGEFVDVAIVRRAQDVLALAQALGAPSPRPSPTGRGG